MENDSAEYTYLQSSFMMLQGTVTAPGFMLWVRDPAPTRKQFANAVSQRSPSSRLHTAPQRRIKTQQLGNGMRVLKYMRRKAQRTTLHADTRRVGKTPEASLVHAENLLGNTCFILTKRYCSGEERCEPRQERARNTLHGFQRSPVLHSVKQLQRGSRRIKTEDVTEVIHLCSIRSLHPPSLLKSSQLRGLS